jgi:hypothetical protein
LEVTRATSGHAASCRLKILGAGGRIEERKKVKDVKNEE